ncbi:UDP-N-acetylmuramyl-tripeptide synthetase [Candidatus Nomurabacteria bacterium]|nr:UDP-N-acetylmuramyl-tripeptide synthetase [Candidatus Nomurabacteria bacterium]
MKKLRSIYHYALALFGAFYYRFPSRKIFVVGITGTKGKSSTVEIVNAILEEAGYKTALAGTIRFKIGDKSKDNLYKMTMPGRAFIQKFLREAVNEGCQYAIIEMTSEGAKQFRNKFVNLDALIVTNISREHIESHGSYENYVKAKISIAKELEKSSKKETCLILNTDDPEKDKFLGVKAGKILEYSIKDAGNYSVSDNGSDFLWQGEKIHSPLPGLFNIYNILAAATFAKTQNISAKKIKSAIERLSLIKGRAQKINAGQNFDVIVDYAHTPDSLMKIYQAFGSRRKICILGNTGGGRDKWKRPEMGKIADTYCDFIILTNEDPYDENPETIVEEMKKGIIKKHCEIIMDRRLAMKEAFKQTRPGDVVIITGKGTDPYIMGPNGTKTPWSDAKVAEEELRKFA